MEQIKIESVEAIEAINKSEVDVSIATAQKFPRNIKNSMAECLTVATMTAETAQECFYALPRAGKTIEGPSVRLAEILVHSWGNINAGFRIIGNDGKKITAQAICHDLQKNVRISAETMRKITDRQGRTFNEDMQIMTGNAAAKIAFRNAVFTCIPKAVTAELQSKIKNVAIGSTKPMEERIKESIKYFEGLGVTEKELLTVLNVSSTKEITVDNLFTLRGLANSIKDNLTTVDEAFGRVKGKRPTDEKTQKENDELAQNALDFEKQQHDTKKSKL